ncbi:MAG TPA: hypothetical protein PKY82_29910, partial [Pyrinomonadaceae bacterium]|nr:hypothetical protein [Pyrinomonadaceae bacterium]
MRINKSIKNIAIVLGLILAVNYLSMEAIAQKKKPKPKPQPVEKSSPADDVFNEGATIFKQKTKESYQAALKKFN